MVGGDYRSPCNPLNPTGKYMYHLWITLPLEWSQERPKYAHLEGLLRL